jgi:Flp pilus assembly protein TadG
MRNLHRSERGAIIIHVAIAMIALLAFSAFVVDAGVMWVAREQAQNAADAGALAGALAAADLDSTANETAAANLFAGQVSIWGQRTDVADIVVSSPLPSKCPDGTFSCIQVDVMRGTPDHANNPHTNYLPTFFAQLVGITRQGVRATATAEVKAGNAVKCIQPYIIPDKWAEAPPPWVPTSTYQPPTGDSYTPPSDAGSSGFTLAENKGQQIVLKTGQSNPFGAGWTQEIDFGGGSSSSAVFRNEINGTICGPTVGFYDPSVGTCNTKGAPTDPTRGCLSVKPGTSAGPTSQGIEDLVMQDMTAHWDGSKVVTDKAPSPRVVPVALFDPQQWYAEDPSGCSGTGCVVRVSNIFGFFIEGMCNDAGIHLDAGVTCESPNKDVVGRMVALPGEFLDGAGTITNGSAFITITALVQ